MIELTRLNGNRMVVNCDLIKYAEASPDTTLTLVTGEKLVVRESCDELCQRVHHWRADVLRGVGTPQPPPELLGPSIAARAVSASSAHRAAGNDDRASDSR